MTSTPIHDEARLDAIVRSVRRRVRAWVWAEEGLRGLAVALGVASGVAVLSRLTHVSPLAWAGPTAVGLYVAVRGALARRFGTSDAALLLDRVSEAHGEVFTAFEKRDPWLLARAAARASSCRMPFVPRGVPRTLWPAAVLAGVLAATPLLPEGQAVATPREREAQAARIDRAAELAAPDPSIEGRLRALAREVRGGETSRITDAVGELAGAVDAARRRARAADIVARAAGGASDAREAATMALEAPDAIREALGQAAACFSAGEAPKELMDAQRALDAGDVKGLTSAMERILDPSKRLDVDTAERLQARVDAIRADLGGTAAQTDSKGAAGGAGAGAGTRPTTPSAAPSEPLDVAGRLREEALRRPTWPSELDPVVREYFGGTAEVKR